MIANEIKNKILGHIEERFSEEEVSIASSKFQIEIPDSPETVSYTHLTRRRHLLCSYGGWAGAV